MKNERGKNVVGITGGTRGIGLAIGRLFEKEGWRVAVCSRGERPADLPREWLHMALDVRQRADLHRFAAQIVENFGGLDCFVNCAGASRWRPLEAIDEAFVAEIVETNLLGTLWGCQAAVGAMKNGGAIVNVSSLAGKRGSANNSAYCASKFAVNGITQSLAKELGARGIRVNAVCPVYVETEYILNSLGEKFSPAGGEPVQKYLETFAKTQTALGRLPLEEEVARTVWFLAGGSASAITGQCINVDCGTMPQ